VLGPAGGVVRRRRGVRVRVVLAARGVRVVVRGRRAVVLVAVRGRRAVVPVDAALDRVRLVPEVRGRLLRLVAVLLGARPVADALALRTAAAVPAAPARIAFSAAAAAGPT
jgi:hypothetical protein